MKIHPRTIPLQRAEIELGMKIIDVYKRYEWDHYEEIGVLAELVQNIFPRKNGTEAGKKEILDELEIISKKFSLTLSEKIRILAENILRYASSAVQAEREKKEKKKGGKK